MSGHVKSCGCRKNRSKINIANKRFNNLIALYPDKEHKNKWFFKCDCGNIKSINYQNVKKGLTTSCGCNHSKITSERFTIDLLNKRFGKLIVIEKNNYKKSSDVLWKCKCDCGNIISVKSKCLLNGNTKSCGCLKSEETSKRFSLNLEGQKFGKLTVLKRNGTFVSEKGLQYSQWLCKCECGTYKTIIGHSLVRGTISSCGCLTSKGEEKIRRILNKLNVNFSTQYSFPDLKSNKNRRLRFDFSIMNDKNELLALLEYQGQQHFDEKYGYFGKQQRDITDNQKREYCYKNNIPLFEITYLDNIELSIQNILSEVF